MLPSSTVERLAAKHRADVPSGRTQEIQRLIGRSLRAVVDMKALGPNTITVDCDCLVADGGTRTASITGALRRARRCDRTSGEGPKGDPILDHVAAVSVGIIAASECLDLDY